MNDDLYQRVKESGLKMGYVAQVLKLSRKGLYLKLKGKIKMRDDEIEVIENLINSIRGG